MGMMMGNMLNMMSGVSSAVPSFDNSLSVPRVQPQEVEEEDGGRAT